MRLLECLLFLWGDKHVKTKALSFPPASQQALSILKLRGGPDQCSLTSCLRKFVSNFFPAGPVKDLGSRAKGHSVTRMGGWL